MTLSKSQRDILKYDYIQDDSRQVYWAWWNDDPQLDTTIIYGDYDSIYAGEPRESPGKRLGHVRRRGNEFIQKIIDQELKSYEAGLKDVELSYHAPMDWIAYENGDEAPCFMMIRNGLRNEPAHFKRVLDEILGEDIRELL